jgi:outer membrane murein-binding lipoprotein Lpp
MKRYIKLTALVALALGTVVLTGCASQAKAKDASAMKLPKVWGYVTGAKFAQLEVDDQLGANTLVVKRVLAPSDAWIVVHLDDNGMPGDRVGFKHVSKGESLDVEVPLKGVTSEKVIVAVHADKGTPGELDFDMMKKAESPDRPFFVDNKELAKVVAVRTFGVKAGQGEASIDASDQSAANGTISIDSAVSPGPAWVVVHLNDNGMPGKRVGFTPIPAGDNRSVVVTLTPGVELTDALLVAVHADRGTVGTLEFNMDDKVNSPDQPYFVDGKEVATKVSVK